VRPGRADSKSACQECVGSIITGSSRESERRAMVVSGQKTRSRLQPTPAHQHHMLRPSPQHRCEAQAYVRRDGQGRRGSADPCLPLRRAAVTSPRPSSLPKTSAAYLQAEFRCSQWPARE
jgi:hypothetical protein